MSLLLPEDDRTNAQNRWKGPARRTRQNGRNERLGYEGDCGLSRTSFFANPISPFDRYSAIGFMAQDSVNIRSLFLVDQVKPRTVQEATLFGLRVKE